MDVAELAEAFKQPSNHGQLMQRVQELMGQGIDVSSTFAAVVSSASTRDITIKKAAYAFLAKYGRTNEELCFLSINTLHQDCADLDPMPLSKGFQDKNAHVRKTAVMACISLFELDPIFVLESEIVDKLYEMLRDRDTQVAVNAILALETILADEGGIVINQNIMAHLIRRYKDWNPSQLQVILGVLCRYKPQTNDEIYEIMNNVDEGLQHPSLAVQMATLRLFIWLCQDLNEIQEDLQKTMEETLLKHLNSSIPELVHASLCHLALVVETTGRLQHNATQDLSALFCRATDSSVIKFQRLNLCTTVALSTAISDSASTFILEHMCEVAGMKSLMLLQKPSRAKLDRHSIEAHVEVAVRAIEAIGSIGSNMRPHHRALVSDLASPSGMDLNLSRQLGEQRESNITKICLERLFRLLVLFSNMEHVLEEDSARKEKYKKVGMIDSLMPTNIGDLDLDDSQTALLLSTVLTSIEQELDRLAKKKKPLRFRYDTKQNNMSSPSHSMIQELQQQQQPGDISRLARISGIRMLLLEESTQQLSLRKQLQESSVLVAEGEDHSSSPKSDYSRAATIRAALEMRAQYALLLQQQVQDMVQTIDTRTHADDPIVRSNGAFLRVRAEQIGVLHLACYLVAFAIEHEDADQRGSDLFRHRLDILAQAVDQLIPGSESESSSYDPPSVDQISGADDEHRVNNVSRDVADRARTIESMFLVPLSSAISLSAGTTDILLSRLRSVSHKNQFDSPIFKTEKYQNLVRQRIVEQFGVAGKNRSAKGVEEDTFSNQPSKIQDMDRLILKDWLFHVGFNTLAATV
ncbi:AP-4 complex subunit beta-1 [Gamsiella multidivaricata]|nr:AP-4 complex subunit beta-1 [Gamsiella multidivaricata]